MSGLYCMMIIITMFYDTVIANTIFIISEDLFSSSTKKIPPFLLSMTNIPAKYFPIERKCPIFIYLGKSTAKMNITIKTSRIALTGTLK